MEKELILLSGAGEGYYEEKKSKFIAGAYPVSSEQEALEIIERIRKKYWDARHNCYAFVIGKNNEITRSSDDGEPSGTAGKPILEVITGKGIHNCLVVVTRYFGGTLLGTGGLVRAYTKAAADSVEKSDKKRQVTGSRFVVTADYNSAGRIRFMAERDGVVIEGIEYAHMVTMTMVSPADQAEKLYSAIVDLTNGKAQIERTDGIDILIDESNSAL